MSTFDFDDLVGQEFDFYGCDEQRFKLDDMVYEVIEGKAQFCDDRRGFHGLPIARVVIEHGCFNDEGYDLIDLHDEHCWLSFGVVYECHVESQGDFEYTPKGPGDQAIT